jgi:hypothetical protein
MIARVSSVPTTAIALAAAPAPAPPPPPPTTLRGRTFADVHQSVMQRSGEMLPDQVVHVADLRMTPEGHVTLPGALRYRLNPVALRGLASMLGLRWDKWFQSASGEERAEEVNRRFQRTPGEKKVRAWADRDGAADGVARAFLAPSFTPIDDHRYVARFVMRS